MADDGKVPAPKVSTKPKIAMGSPGRRTATTSKLHTAQLTAVRDGEENVVADNESGNVTEHMTKMASKIQAAQVRRVEDAARGGLINRKSQDFTNAKNRPNTSLFKTSIGPKALNEQNSPSKKSFNFNDKKVRMADHLYYGVGIQSRKASANRTAKKENKSIDGLAAPKKNNFITNATNTIIYDSAMDRISVLHSQHNTSFLNSSNKSPKRVLKTRNQ